MNGQFLTNNTLLQAVTILRSFTSEVYLVGGCVRDILLTLTPNDYDLVTDIHPDVYEQEFINNGWKLDNKGKNFMVTIVSKNGQTFEIAQYRKDSVTSADGRHPDFVEVGTMLDDANRRDFTINTLYLNPMTGDILDPTGKGLKDLRNNTLRFVGKPDQRIKEDHLRIMRAYRLSTKLKMRMDKNTLSACRKHFAKMIETVSPERIRMELEKLCNI